MSLTEAKNRNYTVFTDASYCVKSRVAGYAYWSRDTDIKLAHSTAEGDVDNSTVAEVRAIVWAVHDIGKSVDLKGRLVIIVSDCLPALEFLEHGPRKKLSGPQFEKARKHLMRMKKSVGFDLKFNHVKGHAGRGTPRNWVNAHCDSECRKQMRRLRDKFFKKQVK